MISGNNKNKKYISVDVKGYTYSGFDPSFTVLNSRYVRTEIDNNLVFATNSYSFTFSDTNTHNVRFWMRDLNDITQITTNNDSLSGIYNLSGAGNLTLLDSQDNTWITQVNGPISVTTSAMTSLRFDGLDNATTIDISGVSNLGGTVYLFANPKLNTVYNPTSSKIITYYDVTYSNLYGTLDMSGLPNVSNFYANNCNNLTGILHNTPTSHTISIYLANDCNLTGTLDLSNLSGLGGQFYAYTNPNLTQIINPTNSRVFTYYQVSSCNLTGTLNLSGLSGLGGSIRLGANSNLTQIINPTSSVAITEYWAYSCNLTGTLDLRGLSGLGGTVWLYENINLNTILNPTSSQIISSYRADNCGLSGSLDLSSLSGLGGAINLRNNPRLKQVFFPTNSRTITSLDMGYVGLTALDISGLSGFGGDFTIYSQDLLEIKNPTSSVSLTKYEVISTLLETLDLRSVKLGGTVNVNNNSNLTEVLIGTSSNSITTYNLSFNNLTGTHSMQGLYNLGGNINLSYNPKLKSIINPTYSTTFVNTYNVSYCDLEGTLDLSGYTNLGGNIYLNSNMKLNKLITPTSSNSFSSFDISYTGLTAADFSRMTSFSSLTFYKTPYLRTISLTSSTRQSYVLADYSSIESLDLSGYSGLYALTLAHCPNLTQVLLPTSNANAPSYGYDSRGIQIYNCNLTGTLDMSNVWLNTGTGYVAAPVALQGNPNLTQIINPSTTRYCTTYYAHSCNLTGTFSFGGVVPNDVIQLGYNPNLVGVVLATQSTYSLKFNATYCDIRYVNFLNVSNALNGNNSYINLSSNNINVSNINRILYELNSITNSGYTGRSITLNGGMNQAPDSSSGGYDGITAKNALVAKGITVTTS